MLGWIAWIIALATAVVAWWMWRRAGRVWPWITVTLVLAAGGGIVRAAPLHLWRGPSASGSGLPLADNPRIMPVYLPSGQEILLNAGIFPILIVSAQDPSALTRIARAFRQISGAKRPVWIVLTGLSSDRPALALHQAQTLLKQQKVSLPWAVQIGPSTLYASRLPALITVGAHHVHRVMGMSGIVHALASVATLPGTHVPTPATTSKHPAPPAKPGQPPQSRP